ncbi:hypothetical protein [uncultured Bdellovibrio sp.]|uniref:hypothetical protein n=1 Tax=Bdellovibrio sp. HCB-162 TaxID=3394234 RepID=UPI0025D56DED|nr:hypothetical protein [uncultured Bdellovibrio sp.]
MMLRTNKGFTAVEVVVGIGLMAALTMVIVSTQLFVSKDQAQLKDKLEDSIDTNLAERVIFSDLNNSDPSYNNVNLKDDKGLSFFDYYPDVPQNALKGKIERDIVLTPTGNRTDFYIMVQDVKSGALLNYDPPAAYNIGPVPADFNLSATLEFQTVNHNNFVKNQRKEFWVDGKILMLDTPARIRPMDGLGNVDLTVAPRSPIFVGSVKGQRMDMDIAIKGFLNIKHPETGIEITTADSFLRTIPSMGGGIPLVRLRPVRFIRYYLERYEDSRYTSTPARLYKTTFENGTWSQPFLLADKVKEFMIRRDSVIKKMIYFKVKKMSDEDKVKTASL